MFRPITAGAVCVGAASVPGSALGLTISSGLDPATRVAACVGGTGFLLMLSLPLILRWMDGLRPAPEPSVDAGRSFVGYAPTVELPGWTTVEVVEVADVPFGELAAGS